MLKAIIFTSMLIVLTGCMHNRADDYVNAQNNPTLKTPAGVTQPTFKDSYPIPAKSSASVVPAPNLVPPGYEADLQAAEAANKE